jgi:hypothetical protein
MMEEEVEFRVPAKLLTNRDAIFLNRLSMREMFQWLVILALVYVTFNYIPLEFIFKLVIIALLLSFGFLFIHAPINGLAGIEWLWIFMRYKLEKKFHQTNAAVEGASAKTLVSVKLENRGQGLEVRPDTRPLHPDLYYAADSGSDAVEGEISRAKA